MGPERAFFFPQETRPETKQDMEMGSMGLTLSEFPGGKQSFQPWLRFIGKGVGGFLLATSLLLFFVWACITRKAQEEYLTAKQKVRVY